MKKKLKNSNFTNINRYVDNVDIYNDKDNVDINKILVSNKVSFSKKAYMYYWVQR